MAREPNTVVMVVRRERATAARPRLESDPRPISTGTARPLEDAFRMSQLDLVR
ncbi:hypothetical protein [Streptomyces sp. NPDC059168]|uniref:hypothetical protein n=1 Tax=Streptomyces sp. NPDC059168 TaxID=3346753 RepID=UPI0036743683